MTLLMRFIKPVLGFFFFLEEEEVGGLNELWACLNKRFVCRLLPRTEGLQVNRRVCAVEVVKQA